MLTRRAAVQLLATTAAAATLAGVAAQAADAAIKIGLDLSLTGADAESAARIRNGALMAFEEINARHELPGYTLEPLILDDGTATAGQYDPAQAATNARKMVSDKAVVAAIGPMMSGAGKAMAPILSQGNLATITPSSTNPDITNPKFAEEYRPAGKAIYFRTVTTDAFQGPNLANYFADKLKVKSVYVLDDSGAYGVGIADSFQKRAEEKGIKVLGRDRLDPKAADYTTILTKIKALNPDALYYGGVSQAGVKLAKQSYDMSAEGDQRRRRRHVFCRDAVRRGLPGRGRLVRHHRLAAHHRGQGRGRLGEAVSGQVRHGAVRLCDHRLRCGAGDRGCGKAGDR